MIRDLTLETIRKADSNTLAGYLEYVIGTYDKSWVAGVLAEIIKEERTRNEGLMDQLVEQEEKYYDLLDSYIEMEVA